MIDALSSIEITDADIEEIERLFGDVKFDDERRQILKHMESTDNWCWIPARCVLINFK